MCSAPVRANHRAGELLPGLRLRGSFDRKLAIDEQAVNVRRSRAEVWVRLGIAEFPNPLSVVRQHQAVIGKAGREILITPLASGATRLDQQQDFRVRSGVGDQTEQRTVQGCGRDRTVPRSLGDSSPALAVAVQRSRK